MGTRWEKILGTTESTMAWSSTSEPVFGVENPEEMTKEREQFEKSGDGGKEFKI